MSDTGSRLASSFTAADVLARLKAIASEELELDADRVASIGLETPLTEGLRLDSLNQVILLARLEETCGVIFSLEERDELLALQTVGDLVRLVQRRLAGPL